ncbi:MAG: polymer-forming cytoskeletal protein [Desulfatitalea sp.]|nr:polymer-forming cytoskeletal protein [Desulfatitalea sp.]
MLGKDKKGSGSDSATISTLLGRDTVIEGTLTFKETIRVDGRISGKLISPEGTVIVGENAVLDADVQVGVAVIRGKINGRVEASTRIEIYAPAQVNGDINAPTISIDSGVFFNGNCKMQTPSSKPIKGFDKVAKETPLNEATNPKAVKNL